MIRLLLLLALTACTSAEHDNKTPVSTEQIRGRGEEGSRPPLYRVKIPYDWVRRDPLPGADLSDTTLSIVDFFIVEDDDTIRIAIHNFPSEKIEQRIPPAAQVARWQRQIENIDSSSVVTLPISFSGYKGLYFEGAQHSGQSPAMVIGWSLQLADTHYRALTPASDQPNTNISKEKRADVTIKATGPQRALDKHKDEIASFAQSFELIEEIPTR